MEWNKLLLSHAGRLFILAPGCSNRQFLWLYSAIVLTVRSDGTFLLLGYVIVLHGLGSERAVT